MIQWLRVMKLLKKTKTIPTNFNEKNITCKTKKLYILLAFSLTTIALLISVKIYCYFIKFKSEQKHLLPYYIRNDKPKNVLI